MTNGIPYAILLKGKHPFTWEDFQHWEIWAILIILVVLSVCTDKSREKANEKIWKMIIKIIATFFTFFKRLWHPYKPLQSSTEDDGKPSKEREQ
jgi:hypothetical protein